MEIELYPICMRAGLDLVERQIKKSATTLGRNKSVRR